MHCVGANSVRISKCLSNFRGLLDLRSFESVQNSKEYGSMSQTKTAAKTSGTFAFHCGNPSKKTESSERSMENDIH